MKIIILGAGQVGSSVAQTLAIEANDVTVVDQRPELLRALQERLDIRTINGFASHPGVLVEAGIEDADLILAVTNSDETNMVACRLAYSLFHTPTRLARVRASAYLELDGVFSKDVVPINYIINPEELVTANIQKMVNNPGVLQILDFMDGRVQLVAMRAFSSGKMVGRTIGSLIHQLPGIAIQVVAVYRSDRAILPKGDTRIETDDEVFFLAERDNISKVVQAFRPTRKPYRRIIIAGGGNIGSRLASALENDYHIKIIEQSAERCRHLAENLHQTIVLHGDAGDSDLLGNEAIGETDIYCAVTDDDETNILSSLLAKRLGVHKSISLINRAGYVDLVQGTAVDIAVSPVQVTIGSILTHIRRGDVVAVHSLRRGAAEVIEMIAHGDNTTSKVVGRSIDELALPKNTILGAIARGDTILFPRGDVRIESEDHVVLFVAEKRQIRAVETLFQAPVQFL